jgi:hypothetical protein
LKNTNKGRVAGSRSAAWKLYQIRASEEVSSSRDARLP